MSKEISVYDHGRSPLAAPLNNFINFCSWGGIELDGEYLPSFLNECDAVRHRIAKKEKLLEEKQSAL